MQIEYLIAEMLYEGSAVGYANYQMGSAYNGYTADDWYNATSVETATIAFRCVFERPDEAKANDETRISKAEEYYEQFKDLEVPTSGTYLDIENIMSLSNLTGTDKTKMSNVIELAINIANDDNYLYSQEYRYQTINGITYYDCSSFLKHVYGEYGVTLPDRTAVYDSSYDQYIVSTSPSSYVNELQPGDVIWKGGGNVIGHVMMYLGNDYWVAARTNDPAKLTKAEQISVYDTKGWTASYLSEYMRVYRFIQ